jgi:hypothetical protein
MHKRQLPGLQDGSIFADNGFVGKTLYHTG